MEALVLARGDPMAQIGIHDIPQVDLPPEAGITESETKLLWKVSHLISSSLMQEDVIQTALEGVVDSVGCDVVLFFLRREKRLELKATVQTDPSIVMDRKVQHHVGECLCGLAARAGEPIYSVDITSDIRCTFQECKVAGMRSFAAIPMKDSTGVLGILGLASKSVRNFQKQAAFLETLAAIISIGIRNSMQHEQMLRHTANLELEIKERNRAERAVRHSEAQLRAFVANAPYGITRASVSHDRFLSVNPATVKMLGYDSEEEILALRLTRDLYWNTQGRRDFLAILPNDGYFSGIEAHWKRKDKKRITVHISGWVVQNPKHPDDKIIEGIFEDVTQQRLLEEQLLQAQKMEAVGRLAGGIAHDFNNLLMVIMAQSELLMIDIDESARHRAEKILEVSRRAAELTGQLLAFSRKQATQPTVTTLNRLLGGVSEMLPRLVGENIDVRVALCEDPWPLKTDRSQFEQVIMNLAVNARDAMPDGGMLTIETANCEIGDEYIVSHPIMPAGKYVMLAVTDSGTGIDPETQEHMFEPFFTTKEPGKGTGLGLSMVYGIVKHNNGFIWVYSEPDQGACFKIYLPKSEGEEIAEVRKTEPRARTAKRKSTVLLVEDDHNLREVITEFLKMGGHTVIVADSLETAYNVALKRKNEIDLLLTDVVLRDGNGNQLVARLEKQGCIFKVVYMSGYSPKAIVHHGAIGAETLFLQKPFSSVTLIEMVEAALSAKA
jgi:signal transduction histidine kinase/CheY-like chemotaxis protein/putative methionine-R-sulfoxide reductase with GAF domain